MTTFETVALPGPGFAVGIPLATDVYRMSPTGADHVMRRGTAYLA
ncbi:hypothetical protein [Streptomyces sp. NPDC047024]